MAARRLALPGQGQRRAPFIRWAELYPVFAERWQAGEHVTVLGPTGSGKTVLLVELAGARRYTLFLATKPVDPLFRELERRGWRTIRSPGEVVHLDGQVAPFFRRIVYRPPVGGTIRGRRGSQAEQLRRALDWAFAAGGWCVLADETLWLSEELRLEPELRAFWYQGRSAGLTLLAASQRPAWLPRAAYSQASYLFCFGTNDASDLARLVDIGGGLDTLRLRRELQLLSRHEFCLIAPREQPPLLLRSKVGT